MPASEQAVFAKVSRKLIPFLMVCYFVAYLDRVNVGFAALTMNKDLGFTPLIYAWGAGIFFIGYFLFEVPSNIVLEKTGARIWIARIMITWGLFSALMATVWNAPSFFVIRFLLGAAEAGFFPGVILYLTYWYPAEQRAKIVGSFMAAIPISSILGAPVSGFILDSTNGLLGYAGWQWLFVIEAIPALLLGFVVLAYLPDGPATAKWLEPGERAVITERLERENRAREAVRKFTLREALTHPQVLLLSLVYFGLIIGLYGIGFWMPQIVKGFGLTNTQTGFVTAIPFVFGAVGMILWTRHSDRTMERTWHVALPAIVGGAAFVAAAYAPTPVLGMIALTVASMGIFAALPTFWTLPTSLLTGTAAAGGIALINSIGNLGGFAGPYMVGWIKDSTGQFAMGLIALAVALVLAGLLTVAISGRREASALGMRPAE